MKRTNSPDKNINLFRRTAIVIGAIITALALALTFALGFDNAKSVSVDSAGQGEAATSATDYTNLASGSDKSAPGALVNGDTITYTTNTIFSLKLPAGTYTLEAWGGQGGQGYARSGAGGKGGYTKATYKITAATTIYIVVGGQGATKSGSSNTMAGGYNGGGSSPSLRSCSHGGGGGGGATHFATATGQLSSLSGNQSAVLLVAGGGGGAGTISTAGGMGGGTSTTAVTTGTSVSTGIVVAGGAGSGATGGSTSAGTGGGTGAFGRGGNGASRSNYVGGAGGGAGWYGGGGSTTPSTCASYPGGGGSSYVKTGLTSPTFQGGQRTGSGQAKITVVSVNQSPTTKSANVSLLARGNSTSIAASTIATDPEGTALGFTANSSSNFDTLPGANAGLWLSTGALATKYFDWNWDNGTLNITNIKYYPRNGIDGSTVDGRLPLYTYVRDSFGTNTTRGTAYISFSVTVAANTISQRAAGSTVNTASDSPSVNKLHFGLSKTATAPLGSGIDTSNIYNPLGVNRYTAVFEQPIRYNEEAKINVADLVLNDGKAMGLDKIVASINSVAAITGTSKKFSVTEYDANSTGLAAYNSGRVKLSYVYETLTFKCVTPDPAYQILSLTIYRVEKKTVLASPLNTNVVPGTGAISLDIVFKMDNTRPALRNDKKVGTGATEVIGPVVKLQTLAQRSINLNDFFMDVDGVNNAITSTSHQIREVVVPSHEYVQTNKHGEFISTKNTNNNKSYFNVLANSTPADKFSNLIETGQLKGDAYTTGFESWYVYNPNVQAHSTFSDVAFVQYSFSNATLTLTGLRATYSMYKSDRTSQSAITGGYFDKATGVSSPITDSGSASAPVVANAGHFYILIRVQDRNDASDEGIWLPLGIEVTNKAPTTMQTERNGAGAGEMPTAVGKKGDVVYFTPMGITINQTVNPIGLYKDKNNNYTNYGLKPLAADADNYYRANMLNGNSLSADSSTEIGKLNELVTITSDIAQLGGTIEGNGDSHYFKVEAIDIYIPTEYFGGRVSVPDNATTKNIGGYYGECVVIKGLKVTLNNWTHNRYLHLDVNVADSAGGTCTTQIAVNVNNQAPVYLEGKDVAQLDYITDGVKVKSEYGGVNDSGVAVIKYSVPAHYKFIVSPYDLLTDADMVSAGLAAEKVPAGLAGGFTLNGLSGRYDSLNGVFKVNSTNASDGVAIDGLATSANAVDYSTETYTGWVFAMLAKFKTERTFGKVTTDNRFSAATSGKTALDQLYFARTNDATSLDGFIYDPYSVANRAAFAMPEIAGKSFVSCTFGNKIIDKSGASYDIDYAVIETNQRTASGSPSVIEFSVRDRTGAGGIGDAYGVKKIRVEINVINSSPSVKKSVTPYKLSTKPISEPVRNENGQLVYEDGKLLYNVVIPSTRVISADSILEDKEDGEVRIDTNGHYKVVDARVGGSEEDSEGRTYVDNYVRVSITQSSITVTALSSTQAIKTLYVMFYATDGRYDDKGVLETSECYIRIEVVNSVLDYNTGENGFTKVEYDGNNSHYLWNVESITAQDKTRTRYFVSNSTAAALVRSNYGASAGQIKYLVSDADALQGAVLSPASNPGTIDAPGYINANIQDSMTDEQKLTAYRNAVPQLSMSDKWASAGDAVAARLAIRNGNTYYTGALSTKIYTDGENKPDIIYFEEVKDENGNITSYNKWNASTLKTSGTLDVLGKFFDEKGRWTATNWAIMVKPKEASDAENYINLRLSLRDDAKHGGDTAGHKTAYEAATVATSVDAAVKGNVLYSYDMFINDIGIVAYTYYNQFNGYYTVTDPTDETKVYVPTYDGTGDSQYTEDMPSLYLVDNELKTEGTGDAYKTRSANAKDSTSAGVHSGALYSSATAAANGYTYPVRIDNAESSSITESAFKYSDTIQISGDKNKYTYIPMSYFALNKSLVDTDNGVITYNSNSYVSYDIGSTDPYVRRLGYREAVTIRDSFGGVWLGKDDNPYVEIYEYDLVDNYKDVDFSSFNQSPYFNHCLSIPTYNSESKKTESFVADPTGTTYKNHIVGENGRIMYLSDQEMVDNNDKVYGLQEHLFGLKIKKKDTRAQSGSLTITIKVVQCTYSGSGTVANYGTKNENTAEVTFKLEIGNSPITLIAGDTPDNSVNYDATSGYYYTNLLDLNIESGTQYIELSRDKTIPSGSRSVITYADDDVVKVNGVVDRSRSDQAKFASSSVKQLKNLVGFERVLERSSTDVFTNVSTAQQVNNNGVLQAQASIRNYFSSNGTELSNVDKNYRPNSGVYARDNNEGYENYFSVGLSADGTRLSITPKAKTIINSDMIKSIAGNTNDISDYYALRGLKYFESDGGVKMGYYPLKVLIYDDHGDGFGVASYVALEIRVAIKGTAAKLSDNLVDVTNDKDEVIKDTYGNANKKIDVSLGIGHPYSLNISQAIVGGSLLKYSSSEGGNIFWKADYDDLKGDTDYSQLTADDIAAMESEDLSNMFKLESGTYLISPFDSVGNIQNYSTTPNLIAADNETLRNGKAGYSSNYSYEGIDTAYLPDVVMYMAYYSGDVNNKVYGKLQQYAIPENNLISFRVNRRTTYSETDKNSGEITYKLQNNFTFVLQFTDSDGNPTAPLHVNIEVVNQAPTILARASKVSENLSMQVGDSFTVLTTPYNRFVGSSETDSSSAAYTTPSTSASNSKTFNAVKKNDGIGDPSLLKATGDNIKGVKFQSLTEAALESDTYRLHSYKKSGGQQHLGYVALADDDMPWGLRIYNVSYYDTSCFETAVSYDNIKLERDIPNMTRSYPVSVFIKARSVCKNMPITFTVVDSDGALTTFTMYVTVESSSPGAIEEGDTAHKLNPALNYQYNDDHGETKLMSGVYQLYMISNNVTDKNNADMVLGRYKDVKLDSGEIVKAYGKVRIPIDEIAYDPDTTDRLLLYAEDRNDDYNVMLLNDSVMSKNNYTYSNGYFTVEVSSDYSWFTIECKTYNPNSDEDVLSFYVRDDGNNVLENAIPIKIRINTLYSSITNDAQMTQSAINQEKFGKNAIASVYVKSFDDYSGLSVDLPKDETELGKIKNVDSTFQFLNYTGMPEVSVDQTANSAKPMNDPDVILSNANLNYELRIYAFMENVGESASEFKALESDAISSLFNLTNTIVQTKVLALRSDTELKNIGVLKGDETLDSKFLVGGSFANGTSMTSVNRSLILFLQRYFMFDIGDDGVSLRFRPISANLDVNIPMYVQIRKVIDQNRTIHVQGVSTVCGDIFYMNVLDSAPIENTDANAKEFKGKVGDSVIFKMFDKDDPFGSLFTDSDLNDVVTYNGFVSAVNETPDYNKALAHAESEKLDWKANDTINKPRAVDIAVNNTDKEVNGIPAYSVKITINRRIDLKDEDGKYLEEVPLPITLFCKDRGGKSVSTDVKIIIQNSNIDIDKTKLGGEVVADKTNGYYVLSAGNEERLYYIDAYVSPYKDLAPFYFVSRDKSYIADPDYTRMSADTDSMRLVGKDSDTSATYLMYNKPIDVTSALTNDKVATVTPIFGNDLMPNDEFHFVGFSIKANTTNRLINDATVTMRIVDRSSDSENTKNGFTVTVRMHILNAAPTRKNAENKPIVVTGSDTKDGTPITIDIKDYITDINGDPIRIVGLASVYNDDASKDNIHCSIPNNSSTGLMDMAMDDKDNTKCSFTYKKGYYGDQAVSIMVADIIDSDDDTPYDYAVVDFRIHFVVGYDIAETKLNDIEATRSLPTKIDVNKLFGNIKDTYGITDLNQEAGEFNPGADYVITDVTASGVKIYKDGDDWMFVSDKESEQIKFNVTFKNKSGLDDPGVKSVTMSFNANIGKNTAPELLPDFKNHTEEGYLFQTANRDYGLDNNGTVTLTPSMLFSDVDLANGDKLTFDPKAISVSSPTICSVRVSEDGTLLYVTFNCRGECDLTVGVMDSTGETTKATFKVKNIDRPDPSFWNKITISYEEYPLIWWGIGIGLLVLIALIILIVLLAKHRKRKREELEAILISEMELEEQMMRLNAGAMGAMPYQSYGYLPPTMNVQSDPNLMLGGGGAAPDPGAIGLNPGGSGVPTDSDM